MTDKPLSDEERRRWLLFYVYTCQPEYSSAPFVDECFRAVREEEREKLLRQAEHWADGIPGEVMKAFAAEIRARHAPSH